jgi:hypothetical protein
MSIDWSLATAGAPPSGSLFGQLWPWLAALLLLVCVGGVAIYVSRRSVGRDETGRSEGFTLQDLRDLHASGSLTDEEFERAKASVIGRVASAETQASEAADHDEAEKDE